MKKFMDLKIGTKLTWGFVFIAFIASVIGVIGIHNLSEIEEADNALYNNITVPLSLLDEVSTGFQAARVAMRDMIVENDPVNIQNEINLRRSISAKLSEAAKKYAASLIYDEDKVLFTKFAGNRNELISFANQIEDLAIQNKDSAAYAVLKGDFAKFEEKEKNLINEMVQAKISKGKVISDSNSSLSNSAESTMIIIMILGALLAVGLGLIITRVISRPVTQVKELILEISKGHLKNRVKINSNDEVGQMAASMNQLADDLQKKVVLSMKKISTGDLNFTVNAHDENDEIAPALQLTIDTLKRLRQETLLLTEAAVQGNLNTRGKAEKFEGSYKDIVDGINSTLDAVILPIKEGSQVLEKMSTGDLTVRMIGEYKGDHQLMKNSINNLGDAVSNIIKDVQDAVEATASASGQISSSSEEMAAGAEEQSQQATEVAGSVEEMTRTILETTKNAANAAEASKVAGQIAKDGGKVVEDTVSGMIKIAAVVRKSAETVQALGKSSDEIGEIVQVIDDIADQTNLLALNAAIEAARAGEQGRGFAVVADEVRKLAERTTKATKEIAGMIKQIQKDTSGAVHSMNQGTEEVEKGKVLADKAGTSLTQIIEAAEKVVDIITQVAAASEQQSAASEQISKNIEAISTVTQQSSAGVQQIARASEDLSRLTLNLQNMITQFKVDTAGGAGEFTSANNKNAETHSAKSHKSNKEFIYA